VTLISLNPSEEAETIADEFPGVVVQTAKRDARAEFGRPLTYLSDSLTTLRGAGTKTIGIVNADVLFTGQASQLRKLDERAQAGELIIVNRFDVADVSARTGEFYPYGFDFFLLPASQSASLDLEGFAFGVPWWDYWFPINCLLVGMNVTVMRSVVFRHVSHPTAWNLRNWHKGLKLFSFKLRAALRSRRDPDTPEISEIRAACESIFASFENEKRIPSSIDGRGDASTFFLNWIYRQASFVSFERRA